MSDDKRHQENVDPQTRYDITYQGGQASAGQQDMSKHGHKGGKAAQVSDNTHKLTKEERSRGGQNSSPTSNMLDDEAI